MVIRDILQLKHLVETNLNQETNHASKQKWRPLYEVQVTVSPVWNKQQVHFPTPKKWKKKKTEVA